MDRTMARGDTLNIVAQVFKNPVTGQYAAGDVGSPPSGFAPVDITGATLWFTAKNNLADTDLQAVAQVSTVNGGIVITNAPSGQFKVQMLPQATLQFPDAEVDLFYDIQLEDTTLNVATVMSGTLTVTPDVTRAIVPPAAPPAPLAGTVVVSSRVVLASDTIRSTDFYLSVHISTPQPLTLTLTPALPQNQRFEIKDALGNFTGGVNVLTILPPAGETIDWQTSYVVTSPNPLGGVAGSTIVLTKIGTNWEVAVR